MLNIFVHIPGNVIRIARCKAFTMDFVPRKVTPELHNLIRAITVLPDESDKQTITNFVEGCYAQGIKVHVPIWDDKPIDMLNVKEIVPKHNKRGIGMNDRMILHEELHGTPIGHKSPYDRLREKGILITIENHDADFSDYDDEDYEDKEIYSDEDMKKLDKAWADPEDDRTAEEIMRSIVLERN